jgi:hypothetical protein
VETAAAATTPATTTPARSALCNFFGTVYANTSRETLVAALRQLIQLAL